MMVVPLNSSAADEPRFGVADWEHDVIVEDAAPAADLGLAATDPLGLIEGLDVNRAYTLGEDRFDVWTCGTSTTASGFVAQLDAEVGSYFEDHSKGRYRPVFTARGSAGSDQAACEQHASLNASGNAEASMVIVPSAGGYARNNYCGDSLCPGWQTFPSNGRITVVGDGYFVTTAAHEIGHLIQWPHSFTGNGWDEYDNAMDLMSGNYGSDGYSYGTYDEAYETAVINRYAAGWIDTNEVAVVAPAGGTTTLSATTSGTQMAVIWDGSSYYTLAARAPTAFDAITSAWAGVEVYRVTSCLDWDCLPGFRRIIPEPAVPFDWSDPGAYAVAPAHVIRSGQARTVGGVNVSVTGSGTKFTVTFGPGADPGPGGSYAGSFSDDDGSVFEDDIEWLASTGVTRGCNPPTNTRFCPDDPVTRGQMAAFLRRALPGLDDSGPVPGFWDTVGTTFEQDIEWLAATGVTRGCNPPTNTRFCPDEAVTRGQMAAFLRRALPGLTANGSVPAFTDVAGSVFVDDIEWLAATGVTRGCTTTAFCPNEPVTRGQMAAFLRRALG